jgi:class 3 adenylate cyclase/pimeloyl-ACP methyl ester carboxylesterase
LIDRLVHHAEVVNLKDDSNRLKDGDLGTMARATSVAIELLTRDQRTTTTASCPLEAGDADLAALRPAGGDLRRPSRHPVPREAHGYRYWMDDPLVAPQVRYARSGDVSIAYQVTGEEHAVDLLLAPGTVSHLMGDWERPAAVQRIERLSSFARLLRFDKRGTGMSDRVTDAATIEERTDDIRAVMDAAGSEAAVLLGASEGGWMTIVFAAQFPERTRGLMTWGIPSSAVSRPGHPWGHDPRQFEDMVRRLRDTWPSEEYVRTWGAGLGPDAPPELVDEWLAYIQTAASPAAVVALEEMNGQVDVRDVLPFVKVPTLVMVREGDPVAPLDAVRFMAERIPDAELRVFPGASHQIGGPGLDPEPVYAAIEEFVTGSPPAGTGGRFLATMLVLDLVQSTEHAARIGDESWRNLLQEHNRRARHELARHHGVEVSTTGDGLLATFDGPAAAIRCARAIQGGDRAIGLACRAGVHCGEVERVGTDIGGIAVHTAARIASSAGADEILVSSTVRDLAAGSGLTFGVRGPRELKGVPGATELFELLWSTSS